MLVGQCLFHENLRRGRHKTAVHERRHDWQVQGDSCSLVPDDPPRTG